MNKYIIFLCTTLACSFSSCQDDLGVSNGTVQRNPGKGLPVTFITEALPPMESAGDAVSRADDPYKQSFEEGDYLHVSATFTLLDEKGEVDESNTISQYELLRFNAEEQKWESSTSEDNEEAEPMTWPWNAASGKFTAYFIGVSDGLLGTKTIALDTLTYKTDPLKAEVTADYGHAVSLKFEHLCAKLTFTNVSSDAIEFWAKNDEENGKSPIRNQFKLSVENGLFKEEFISTDENAHIAARLTNNTLTYYVAPDARYETKEGNYYGMKLNYRYDRPYRGLNIEGLSNLEAGTSYIVDFNKHTGSIIIEDDDNGEEEPGEDEAEPLETVNIDEFLDAISKGTPYELNNELILAAEGNGSTVLLKNVNFQGKSFKQNHELPSTAKFDGNGHYIQNVAQPLFSNIQGGRIANLGIYNDDDVTIVVNSNPEDNIDAVGVIAGNIGMENTTNLANIDNIRLSNITIQVKPPYNSDLVLDVGAVVGNCQGWVNNIRLVEDITVEVKTVDKEREIGTVNVGGVIGQLTSSGHLSQVSRMEEENPGTITVTNDCPNQSNDRNTGGLVGLSNGSIEDCILSNATVSSLNSSGTMVYTGGLVGMIRGTKNVHDTNKNGLVNSKFDGVIRCGKAYSESSGFDIAEGHAYAGGAVGYVYWADGIKNNEISGTLQTPGGNGFEPYEHSIYATGGLFGQAVESPTSGNTTWIAIENQYNGESENYYIGKIAGRADVHSTPANNQSHTLGEWEDVDSTITSADLPAEEK